MSESGNKVWQSRIAKFMVGFSAIAGFVVFSLVLFEVGYYMVHGSYYLPHPNLRADFGTMLNQAFLYWGLPFAIAFAPVLLSDAVRDAEDLEMGLIIAVFGTLAAGVGLMIAFGIGLLILNIPLSIIVLVIHLILGAFADSVAYGVIVTVFFVCMGVGLFSMTAGPVVYRVVIVIFRIK